ncbi:MAG: ribonuclease Z [Saprospiraceae bacterium]|nr:ribonuclease Z [Saprospiraceae bacterium]
MVFQLTILGTSAAVPTPTRFLSGQVLNMRDQLFLIDCGEGTQSRLTQLGIKKSKINHIFISHLHGDHVFGLVGVLTSMAMQSRKHLLTLYGPTGLQELVETTFRLTYYQSPFPIQCVTVDADQATELIDNESFSVKSFPLKHRIPCVGYVFREKEAERTMKVEKIAEYAIPFTDIKAIKRGADFKNTDHRFPGKGVLIPNSDLTTPPPSPRSFAYCSDTAFDETIVQHIRGVDLLYHETTFLSEMTTHAEMTGHSTALQAGQMAHLADVGQLVTGHYSSRYDELNFILDEAKSVFPNTVLGIDGQTYSVPLVKTPL